MKKSASKHGSSYRARWTNESGVRESKCFASKIDRDHFLAQRKIETREIKSGLRKKVYYEKTFKNLSDFYLLNVAPTKKSAKDLFSIINFHLIPFFGKWRVSEITQEQVNQFIALRANAGATKKTISNNVTVLVTLLNLALDMRWISEKPRIKKPKVSRSRAFSYLRTAEEIKKFANAAKAHSEIAYVLFMTALLTGMRQGEIAALTWDDVNFESRIIVVQKSFKETTKSEQVRYVPINDKLLPLLLDWKKKAINNLLFPSSVGKMFNKSASIFQEVFKKVLDDAGFEKIERNGHIVRFIRFHDLRHTYASHFMMAGGNIYMLQKILGHSTVEMTMIYAHLSPHVFQLDHGRFNSIEI